LIEIALELEHVAKIVGALETERAILFRRHRIIAHSLPDCLGHDRSHLLTGQMFTCDSNRLPGVFLAALENSQRAFSNVLDSDSGTLFTSHRHGEQKRAVRPLLWPHAEEDQI